MTVSATRSRSEALVDILDRVGQVTGTTHWSRVREHNLRHRTTYVVVASSRAEVLVRRRPDSNELFPGWWDVGIRGVPAAGEAWLDAAVRSVRRALGIEISAPELHHVGDGRCDTDEMRVAGLVYRLHHDGPFEPGDDEKVEAEWVPVAKLEAWVSSDAHKVCPDSMSFVLPLVLSHPPLAERAITGPTETEVSRRPDHG